MTALPASPLPDGSETPSGVTKSKGRSGGRFRGFLRREAVFTFAYRVLLGLVAFLFAVFSVSLVHLVSGLSIGPWIAPVQLGVVATIVLFGEHLREATYDIAAKRIPPVVLDIQTGLRVAERTEASLAYSRAAPHNAGERTLKRALDVLTAGFALVLVLPMLVITAIAIKLDSPGPVFISSRRIGRNGKEFQLRKFRTRAVAPSGASVAAEPFDWVDERGNTIITKPPLTRLGALLRSTNLDELPLLWNVLLGDMSLVGPAPLAREELFQYGSALSSVLSIRPGLTGPWRMASVERNALFWPDAMGSRRGADWSFIFDARILVQTYWLAHSREQVADSKNTN